MDDTISLLPTAEPRTAEPQPSDTVMSRTLDEVREFHRFFKTHLHALEEVPAQGRFSETEARVILALGRTEPATATSLRKNVGVAAGYMSRIVTRLHEDGLVAKTPSVEDRRSTLLALTEEGRNAEAVLDQAARGRVGELLGPLSDRDRERLVDAMDTIVRIFTRDDGFSERARGAGKGGAAEGISSYLLRPPRAGDMGWVIRQHGVLYADEFGWEVWFEGLTAQIVARFVENQDPKREHCWIAEKDGENVGSVFCVKESDEVARLRMLLVGPEARGLGIGRRLVEECIRFARRAGYERMTLWTYDVLDAARRIYADVGFELVRREPHSEFGAELVEETWELDL